MSLDLHRLTPCPPMGWNNCDSFGCFINERRALENLRCFVERLKPDTRPLEAPPAQRPARTAAAGPAAG